MSGVQNRQWRNDGVAGAYGDGAPLLRAPHAKKVILNPRGPRPEKVTRAPNGCVTPLKTGDVIAKLPKMVSGGCMEQPSGS